MMIHGCPHDGEHSYANASSETWDLFYDCYYCIHAFSDEYVAACGNITFRVGQIVTHPSVQMPIFP